MTCTKQRGIHVPEVLRGYMGTDFLPFVRSEEKHRVKEASGSQNPSASLAVIERMNSVLASYTFLEGENNRLCLGMQLGICGFRFIRDDISLRINNLDF